MPVEFIGIARTADRSETIAETGPAVQPEYLYHLAVTHEQSGFDRVLVAHSSSSPDGFIVADQVLNATSRLGVLLAHRPGFVAPTIAATCARVSSRSTDASGCPIEKAYPALVVASASKPR